jgi:hypothetical protein
MAHLLSDHERNVVLSAEQFDKLVELLTPGYEAAKIFLAARAAENGTKVANPAASGDAPKGGKTLDDLSG